jgi:Zn-dependent peptidase ImmA (M78 family)/DNA-binding XRE family transcriptional regulator
MPTRVPALVKSELLVWARQKSGLELAAAAKKIGVTTERVAQWESGEAQPSISQLRKAAQAYHRPLALFYLPKPPNLRPDAFDAMHDFRRLLGEDAGQISPELVYEIRKARERRALVGELTESLHEAVHDFLLRSSVSDDPDQLAERIRSYLHIQLKHQHQWKDPYVALNAWKNAVEQAGVLVFQTERIPLSNMRGMSVGVHPLPVIMLNGEDSPRAKIFTLAHELAHIALNETGICDLDLPTHISTSLETVEAFCNRVAGAVLVPAGALRDEIGSAYKSRWADDEIADLSERFAVSREVILRRLVVLGVATEDFYRLKRHEYLAAYDMQRAADKKKQKESRGGPPRFRMILRDNGLRYTRVVLDAYYDDIITIRDVSSYLGTKLKHLPAIQQAALKTAVEGE